MLFLTAQRRSEVAGMRWDQIDLEAETWLLTSDEVKSARQHLVSLSPQAVALLRSTPRLGEFVWTSDGKTHVKGLGKAKMRLDGFLAAAGAPLKPWRLHDVRRTVATHLVRLGVTETIVGRVLNHAPQGVTARTYALHSYEPEKRSALTRWRRKLSGRLPGSRLRTWSRLMADGAPTRPRYPAPTIDAWFNAGLPGLTADAIAPHREAVVKACDGYVARY
jgi:integrase